MITVANVLAVSDLGPETVVEACTDAPVGWVVTSELADPTSYLAGGEIVLLTEVDSAVRGPSWRDYVHRLTDCGVVAPGSSRMIPRWFGRLHPKYRTPSNALLFVGALSFVAPFFGAEMLGWLVDSGSPSIVIAYALVSVVFVILRRRAGHGPAVPDRGPGERRPGDRSALHRPVPGADQPVPAGDARLPERSRLGHLRAVVGAGGRSSSSGSPPASTPAPTPSSASWRRSSGSGAARATSRQHRRPSLTSHRKTLRAGPHAPALTMNERAHCCRPPVRPPH